MVVIADPQVIERLDELLSIHTLPPESLTPSPYDVRETDTKKADLNRVPPKRYKELHARQKLLSYPLVHQSSDDEYVIIAGHRRIAAAEHAGFDEVPVRVVDVSDWTATQMFVHEHFPLPAESSEDDPELYDSGEIDRSLARLRQDWSDSRLESLFPLRKHLNQLQKEPYP